MTPAINILKKADLPYTVHQYKHDPSSNSYGLEASEKLNIPSNRTFKTLIASLDDGRLAVAIIPVELKLNLKSLAKAAGCKKAEMADRNLVQKSTGYVLGGVSPLGQKKKLVTFLHVSAMQFDTIFFSGGKRGLEIELAPADLLKITAGTTFPLCT